MGIARYLIIPYLCSIINHTTHMERFIQKIQNDEVRYCKASYKAAYKYLAQCEPDSNNERIISSLIEGIVFYELQNAPGKMYTK